MASCRIEMSPPPEIFAGEGIDVEIPFAAKRAFYLLVPVDDQRGHFNALDGKGIVYQSFRIAGLDLETHQILPGDRDKRRIVFIIDIHPALQHIPDEPQPVLQEIIEKVLMD